MTSDTPQNQASKARILIVEDESLISLLLEVTLSDAGYDVAGIAGSVPEALEMVDNTNPTLAILDLNLKGLKVYPVADKLTAAGIPFIFATGGGLDVEGYQDCRKIRKPFREAELLRSVADALA